MAALRWSADLVDPVPLFLQTAALEAWRQGRNTGFSFN
jgi:hypothetical protein